MEKGKIVVVFKAFSDVSRVEILALLKDGEMCGNDILEKLKISQSTLSHHMKILCESGIVNGRKEGKWTYYSISGDGSARAKVLLEEILDARTSKAEIKSETSVKKATFKKAAKKPASNKSEAAKESAPEKAEESKTAKEKVKEEPALKPQKPKRRQMDSWLL